MVKLKRLMLIFLTIILGGYLLICLGLYLFQDSLIFFPRKLSENSSDVIKYKNYEITINSGDIRLHGWLLNKGREKLLIYYGGNGDQVSYDIPEMLKLEDYSVLLLNYRGYGLSEGRPGEKEIFSDALNVFDFITSELKLPPGNVTLLGRSLGSGVAVYVASKRSVARVILATPFDSIRNIAKSRFPIFPVGLILRHPFESIKYASDVACPAMIIMAGKDSTIPNGHSLNLANSWPGRCDIVKLDQADHNDINTYPEFWEAVKSYLKQ